MEQFQDGIELLQLPPKAAAQSVKRILDLANVGEEITDLNRQIATIPGAVVATERKGTK